MNMHIAVEIESVIFRIVINYHLNIYSLEYIIEFLNAISAQTLFRFTLLSTRRSNTVTYEVK